MAPFDHNEPRVAVPPARRPQRAPKARFGRQMTALMATVVVVLAAGCGQATQDASSSEDSPSPTPTLGSQALSSEEAAALEVTTTALERPTEEILPVGPPLAVGASADDIREAVESVHGRTDDLSGQMNRFVSFPQIPTPDGASITEIRADARNTLDGLGVVVVAEVTFEANGSPEELIEFYAGQLGQNGWSQTSRHGRSSTGSSFAHRLSFEIPDSAYALDDFSVLITADRRGNGSASHSEVRLRYVELQPAGSEAGQLRFENWAATLPLPEGATLTGSGIQTSSIGRNSLHLSLGLSYGDTEPEALAEAFRADLPTSGYDLVDTPQYGDKLDNWVYFSGPGFDSSWISTHLLTSGRDEGRTVVNIDARTAFVPASLKQ